MQRITITLDKELLAGVDAHLAASNATNRSEAIRDLIRRGLRREAQPDTRCLGVASYTLIPDMRDLGMKVPKVRQDHHDKVSAAMSVPVDHSTSLEVAVLKGTIGEVEAVANTLFLERGVRHGRLALIPVSVNSHVHTHGEGEPHSHLEVVDRFR